jgi:F-type H+-transporting ATPase subunit epsilon
MNLKILLPTSTLVDREADRVVAEAADGSFCLLPRHVDFVAAIVPGILSFTAAQGGEFFVAVDEGILVKQGDSVLVSVRNAAMGEKLRRLEETVAHQFRQRDQREKNAQRAMSRIEAGFVRRFLDIQRGE